jgi:hypothetical protein
LETRGRSIVKFWVSVMMDPGQRTADRLAASKLLADRGWGAAPMVIVDDPPAWEDQQRLNEIAIEFDAAVRRLAERNAETSRGACC